MNILYVNAKIIQISLDTCITYIVKKRCLNIFEICFLYWYYLSSLNNNVCS